MKTRILLTGLPGSGKSTLVRKVVASIRRPATGFITEEIREKGKRTGFSIITLDGRKGILAHEKLKSSCRVGKYGVSMGDLENMAVPSMIPESATDLVVIDEIGKMECFSILFKKKVIEILDTHPYVLGTIALKGNAFIEKIKNRNDVELITVTPENRDRLAGVIQEKLDLPYSDA